MNVRGMLTQDSVESFLTESTIPVRLGCRTPNDRLWIVALWYRFDGGSIQCATAAQADIVRYLQRNPDVAFDVSTNDPPYRGVRGNGTASVDADPEKEVLRGLLDRYLGGDESPLARRLLSDDRDEVTITVEPESVYGWDYSERMKGR